MIKDSGGFGAKYGPRTAEAKRPDGQWVRIKFHQAISNRRAKRFAAAISAGKPIPPNAQVTIWEVPPPYQFPGLDFNSLPWRPITGAPVGELHEKEWFEAKVALPDGSVTIGVFRADFFKGWAWFDPKGRHIAPTHFAYLAPPPPRD